MAYQSPILGSSMGSSLSSGFHYLNSPFGDTTLTNVFFGGLAWETQSDTLRRYFEQFGEILEAIVITDKNTGRSKGYDFFNAVVVPPIWSPSWIGACVGKASKLDQSPSVSRPKPRRSLKDANSGQVPIWRSDHGCQASVIDDDEEDCVFYKECLDQRTGTSDDVFGGLCFLMFF